VRHLIASAAGKRVDVCPHVTQQFVQTVGKLVLYKQQDSVISSPYRVLIDDPQFSHRTQQ